MYKLFVGFKKLGEFDSILIAKQYAHESGTTGVFDLFGTNGYQAKKETKKRLKSFEKAS